jgi:putative secretion ATPase (PEP-CTERM system associated)
MCESHFGGGIFMNYTDFFGLRAPPFNLTPDLKFHFRSEPQRKALSYLNFGLSKGEGFVVITGEIGAGKTLFIEYFLDNLPKQRAVTATISSTQFEADSILRMAASAFGLRDANAEKAVVFRNLEAFLHETHRRNARAILIVDEAQGLPISALEELRMLSNLYIQSRSLLQIFLIGQPGLRRNLASAGLEQLRQRIVAIYHLTPHSEAETKQYILHRLRTAGWHNDPLLAEDFFSAIYRETHGTPRLINNLCDRLLWHAFVEEKHAVGEKDVELVIQDMKLDAEGLSLELDLRPDFATPSEPTAETEIRSLKQAVATSDRVIDFRNPVEREK